MELTLVRQHDVPAIGEAALLGDAVAAGLWRAVQSFEAGCFGKVVFVLRKAISAAMFARCILG